MSTGKKRKALGAEEAAKRDPTALAHAVDLIFATCCLAGAPSVIADFSDEDKLNVTGMSAPPRHRAVRLRYSLA